ncbi:protein kinase domain-containing protein [Nonomuraea sp. KM90]|uniref:protein kinase domain-containing protein n=1 Tax=Nonomuraea sp. KM90 TaxID=3457428 RepID=UPI003FCDA75D
MAEKDASQPERIGGHEITGRLGEGPRGVVYLGRESEEAPQVAVKTLSVTPDADPGFGARLKSVTRVSSSYVARTFDAGTDNGLAYVIREHIEGRSLAEAVAADGPLTGDALERVAVGTLTALTAVHLAGFAHRGLTPSNVILTVEGPRVTDIELGDPAGEIGHRAPEQLGGLQYGPYADVFSWATTVVFAATGSAPFGHDPENVLNGEPEIGELPEPLRQVVLAALAKKADGRLTAYTALLRLLGDRNAPVPAPPAAGSPVLPPAVGSPVPPPAILPIQLPVDGAQTPLMPPPAAPMDRHPAHPAPVHPAPVQPAPVQPAPVRPGPMGPGPIGAVPMEPMAQAPTGQAPMGQGPMGLGTAGPAYEPQMWGPPPGPAQQGPPQPPAPPAVPGQGDGRERRPFPVGLVAGLTAVVLLSGLGVWGASQYSGKVKFAPIAAATREATGGGAFSALNQGEGAVTGAPTQPQPEMTAPWVDTAAPDESGVGPMTLPTEDPTGSPTVPVLTTVPTPGPISTQPVPLPTAQPTGTQQPQPSAKPTKSPKPKATVTKTVPHSRRPTPSPTRTTEEPAPTPTRTTSRPAPTRTTQEPKPTPTKTTQKPAPTKTTQKPTPTRTTQKPTPTPTRTTPPPVKKNPYTAAQVCGGGFVVQRSSSFTGGTTYQLWNNSTGQNCVVTLKSGADVGRSTRVSATLEVQGGGSKTDAGNFEYYAGPVILAAKGKCVRYSGSAGSGSTSAGWANCG